MSGTGQSDPRPAPSAGPLASPVRPEGLVLSPFRALRYDPATAGDLRTLTSPPYDVIDADGVSALEAASEHNVVRLILPRERPDGDQDRYARAAATLTSWRGEGVLRPDSEPALYVYEQAAPGGHVQRGLLGALSLTPPEDDTVLPHENTMAGPVSDRLALYIAVAADLEPIFLVYDGGGAASAAVASVDAQGGSQDEGGTGELLVDVVLGDGLRHRLWALTDPALLAGIAADLLPRTALIADGHHRYATYLRRQEQAYEDGRGAGPWDRGLCLLVDATAFGPQVHPIHRVVPGRPAAELARLAESGLKVRPLDDAPEAAVGVLAEAGQDGPAFLLVDGTSREMFLLTEPDPAQLTAAVPAGHSADWAALDVSVLHTLLVDALWQLPDDVEHVGFAHSVDEAIRDAAGSGGTAVLLNPTPVEAVAAVAGAGERMPRKSTLFTPKPRTGLVLRDHRDD